jgi:hypothetical protein
MAKLNEVEQIKNRLSLLSQKMALISNSVNKAKEDGDDERRRELLRRGILFVEEDKRLRLRLEEISPSIQVKE